jgi:hypothetical protein
MSRLPDLDSELQPTIDPKKLTLADWRLIADIQEYKIPWVFKSWAKAKGAEFLQSVGIDHWLKFATFLGYRSNWATERYLESKGNPAKEEVA